MRKFIYSFGLAVGLLVICSSTFAHHGRGVAFDDAHKLVLTGTVTKVAWTNPHVFIYYDVKDDKGVVTNWGVEWTNPRSLIRLGLSPDDFKEGVVIKMNFAPAKSGAPRGEIQQAWNGDGKMIYDGSSGYKGNIDDLFDDSKSDKK